jgi:rhomboid protease GluP
MSNAEARPIPHDPPRPTPAPAPPPLAERLRHSPLTFALIVVNVAVMLWAESHGRTTEVPVLLQVGAAERLHVWAGEPWRLVTPMFLHIGWQHLLWNSYAAVGWCTVVERTLGSWRFALVYLLSGIGGAALSVVGHEAVSAGASGAVFGIIGATFVLRQQQVGSWKALTTDRYARSTAMNIALWTVLGLAIHMDNFGHLGGLLTGAAVTWVVTRPRPRAAAWTAFAILFAALIADAVRPWWRPTPDEAAILASFGAAYARGEEGYPVDPARAARFFHLACDAGNQPACVALLTGTAGSDHGAP